MGLVSTNLCAIPFLGHTDNSRLQMAAKQLNQAVTNPNCEVPKIIGQDFRYLSDSTRLFKYTAPMNGSVVYVNESIMIASFIDENDYESLEIFNIPSVIQCSSLYSTRLRYVRQPGLFKTGDLLYEYDCFKQSIPTYGYTMLTAFMPFFGFNHEDSYILSETAANRCRSTKYEQILIPIYTHSLFKNIYEDPNSFGFIPNIGQKIKDNIVACKSQLKNGRNPGSVLKGLNITNFTNVLEENFYYNTIPITSRITNATVLDIRIHNMSKDSKKLFDKSLQDKIDNIRRQYASKIKNIISELDNCLPPDEVSRILSQNYILSNNIEMSGFDKKELVYLIEMKLVGESKTKLGDKFSNRYANKGVVSLILPDELRPYLQNSKEPINVLTGPISLISRMNFGQVLETILSKAVVKSERLMLEDSSNIPSELKKLSVMAEALHDHEYAVEILKLTRHTESDESIRKQFINSLDNTGLYFEAPNFANVNLDELRNTVESEFDVNITENIVIPKETIKFMTERLHIDMPVPDEDLIMPNILVSPVYTIKLKQESAYRCTSRDFGNYKATTKQPSQGRNKDGLIAQGSRLGQMELNLAPLHSNVYRIIR